METIWTKPTDSHVQGCIFFAAIAPIATFTNLRTRRKFFNHATNHEIAAIFANFGFRSGLIFMQIS